MKQTLRHTLLLGLTLLTGVLSWACSGELPEVTHIDKFRVLGVRTDDPTLAEGESTTIDALLFDPEGRAISYEWSWCPGFGAPDEGFPCAFTQEEFNGLLTEAGVDPATFPPFELGTEPTTEFPFPGDTATMQGLCNLAVQMRPTQGELDDCDRFFAVGVKLVAKAGNDELMAIKDVTLLLDPEEENLNPVLTGWTAEHDGDSIELVDGAILEVGKTYDVITTLEDGAQESYLGPKTAQEPNGGQKVEGLSFSWFSTGGEHNESRTGTIEGTISLDEAKMHEWKAPSEPGPHTLFVVVRDGRGGIDWLIADIEVQ